MSTAALTSERQEEDEAGREWWGKRWSGVMNSDGGHSMRRNLTTPELCCLARKKRQATLAEQRTLPVNSTRGKYVLDTFRY